MEGRRSAPGDGDGAQAAHKPPAVPYAVTSACASDALAGSMVSAWLDIQAGIEGRPRRLKLEGRWYRTMAASFTCSVAASCRLARAPGGGGVPGGGRGVSAWKSTAASGVRYAGHFQPSADGGTPHGAW